MPCLGRPAHTIAHRSESAGNTAEATANKYKTRWTKSVSITLPKLAPHHARPGNTTIAWRLSPARKMAVNRQEQTSHSSVPGQAGPLKQNLPVCDTLTNLMDL
ncbi:hypothetical protein E2C01_098225 [Portunus trituberculatus]|uniref:Uncharacterized protein n=1 Tax=Portunus trituberculatus TaxID=210409 RepID=A0A5B7K6J7_PORTR|nr:hypothetical protein [Portunus trituberculatus]